MNSTGVICLLFFEALVLLGGYLAYRDNFLTARQMVRNKGITNGLPFLAHGGMWGDFFLISPLLAIIVSRYATQWSGLQMFGSFLLGFFISFIMHEQYKKIEIPESHVYGGKTTKAGEAHKLYMIIALSIIILFFFCTRDVPKEFIIIV
jgi:hypothetical protein